MGDVPLSQIGQCKGQSHGLGEGQGQVKVRLVKVSSRLDLGWCAMMDG